MIPTSALHLFILRLMFNTILNLSVTSSQLSSHVTYHYSKTNLLGFRAKPHPLGARLACLWLAYTEQHYVVCLAETDTEQTEAFQTSGWPWTSVISPSGAAGSANSQRIVLTQLPCFIQSNFTLIILNLALTFLPCSGEWDFVQRCLIDSLCVCV